MAPSLDFVKSILENLDNTESPLDCQLPDTAINDAQHHGDLVKYSIHIDLESPVTFPPSLVTPIPNLADRELDVVESSLVNTLDHEK
jgi:hypothetical protein